MAQNFLRVSETTMRKVFNSHILPRINSGELKPELRRENHPSPPLANEPFSTRSQILAYRDRNGKKLAIIHRYLRPDGTIGLSGKPDPKWLVHNSVIYGL